MYQIHSLGLKILSLIGVVLFFALAAGSASAQRRQSLSPEEQQERFEKQLEELVAVLELSEEQTPQFVEIMEATNADRVDLMEDMRAGADRGAVRDKMVKLSEQTDLALADVLSSEQMEKYKEIQAQRRSQRGRRNPES